MGQAFPKSARLRKRSEFLAVQRRGRKLQSDYFLLLIAPSQAMRIGVTISSKVGNAIVRNRLKRWVREYVRRRPDELPLGDLVVVGKPSAAAATHPFVDADLARLFTRARSR